MRRAPARSANLPERLDALRAVLDIGRGRLEPEAATAAHLVLDRAGERLRLSGEHTVVALAGATGSGKSSLFNALTGLELARVGVRRPTTGEPMASVWGPEGAGPLLDWLGVPKRHQIAREAVPDQPDQPDRRDRRDDGREGDLHGLVLLDLPDHDSTELAHRLQVDRLVEMVDAMVWVVDPQKYADAALHEHYLRRLSAYEAVTVVVLNQVDRLDAEAAAVCEQDLRALLAEDGLGGARLLSASARTGDGIHGLREVLVEAVQRREAATARISADLDDVVQRLSPSVGDAAGGPVGGREERELAEALGQAAGVPAVVSAIAGSYRARARAATGWPFTRWLGRLRPDPLRRLHLEGGGGARTSLPVAPPVARAQVDTAVRRVAAAAGQGLPPEWERAVQTAARPDREDLADALDHAVATTPLGADRRPVWWRLLGAVQWVLAAAVVVGLGWLIALFAIAWLQLPDPPTAEVEGLPLPTVLLVGGLVGGLLVAAFGRLFGRVGGRRRAHRAEKRLRESVNAVADRRVLTPVREELARHARARDELSRARRR